METLRSGTVLGAIDDLGPTSRGCGVGGHDVPAPVLGLSWTSSFPSDITVLFESSFDSQTTLKVNKTHLKRRILLFFYTC